MKHSSLVIIGFVCLMILSYSTGCAREPVRAFDVDWRNNVEYLNRDNAAPLRMDIAMPRGSSKPAPAVVWIHGGAWAYGSKNFMRPLTKFTASLGYVSATVQYRLVNKKTGVRFPDPVQDVAAAVRFLRKNAAEYGIDPDRIAIGGESAGGHLALMAGLCRDQAIIGTEPYPDVSSNVSGIINLYGPTDLRLLLTGAWWVKIVARDLVGCEIGEDPSKWDAASPITHVREDGPPILTLHGTLDSVVPYSQAKSLVSACNEKHARHTLGRVPISEHAWVAIPRGTVNTSTLPIIANFLGQIFGL
ncbi:MAG: alpha/beta hydrolase [Phycisphaerae bacterium]|nr:alpha/beta hydrolase [Phycisphaerae bacterium]